MVVLTAATLEERGGWGDRSQCRREPPPRGVITEGGEGAATIGERGKSDGAAISAPRSAGPPAPPHPGYVGVEFRFRVRLWAKHEFRFRVRERAFT
jgi:hypothetical protein